PDAPFVARAPRLDAAAQPRFLDLHALVELLPRERFVREPLLLLPKERRVVAGPRRQLSAIDLDDARRDALQKRPIVRDEDDGAGIFRQKRFDPGDRVELEVIGRLV